MWWSNYSRLLFQPHGLAVTRLTFSQFCRHHLQLGVVILVLRGRGLQSKVNLLTVIRRRASGRLKPFCSTTVIATIAVLHYILYNCVWLPRCVTCPYHDILKIDFYYNSRFVVSS